MKIKDFQNTLGALNQQNDDNFKNLSVTKD